MPKIKPSLALSALAVVALAVWAGAQVNRSGASMAVAAGRLLDALDDGQRKQATFEFDDPERLNWHFIPRERKGLPLKAMTAEQRALAFGLLETGLGDPGNLKATTIMSLEAILRDMEKGSGPVRDPELYYFTLFGRPANSGKWGWRVEGHHLSLNFVVEDGQVVASTPAFFGSNPAEVRDGPRKGLRTLAELEDRALMLLQALDEKQTKAAVVSAEAPKEIRSGDFKGVGTGLAAQPPDDPYQGLAAADMTAEQRRRLESLIEAYAADMSPEIGSAWLSEVEKSDKDEIRFAWWGDADRTKPHAYKVQGPSFLIEFNNTQNNANHIHTVWRNRLGDLGVAAKK